MNLYSFKFVPKQDKFWAANKTLFRFVNNILFKVTFNGF
jgi:hypothetical protein